MATTPDESRDTRSASSPMVAVPGAWEAPVTLGAGIGMTMQMEVQDQPARRQSGRVASLAGQPKRCHHGAWTGRPDGQSENANTGVYFLSGSQICHLRSGRRRSHRRANSIFPRTRSSTFWSKTASTFRARTSSSTPITSTRTLSGQRGRGAFAIVSRQTKFRLLTGLDPDQRSRSGVFMKYQRSRYQRSRSIKYPPIKNIR